MVNKHTRTMRYFSFFVIIMLTLGLTCCQSQSDDSTATQNHSATAGTPENVKPMTANNSIAKAVTPLRVNPSAMDLTTAIAKVAKEAL